MIFLRCPRSRPRTADPPTGRRILWVYSRLGTASRGICMALSLVQQRRNDAPQPHTRKTKQRRCRHIRRRLQAFAITRAVERLQAEGGKRRVRGADTRHDEHTERRRREPSAFGTGERCELTNEPITFTASVPHGKNVSPAKRASSANSAPRRPQSRHLRRSTSARRNSRVRREIVRGMQNHLLFLVESTEHFRLGGVAVPDADGDDARPAIVDRKHVPLLAAAE